MSKLNSQTKQSDIEEEEKYNMKRKPWDYPDPNSNFNANQNRPCCSPVDEIEAMETEDENVNATQSIRVQTDKSLFLSKQDKRVDNNIRKSSQVVNKEILDNKRFEFPDNSNVKNYQINEFENVKLKKTGFSYEHEKITAKLADNVNSTEAFDEYSETDIDQPMDYSALCFDESSMDEGKKEKENPSYLNKNEFTFIEEVVLENKGGNVKSKGAIAKEPTKNKKEMFGNTGRSFKEIFNFFKDRDKKRSSVESTKASTFESPKLIKTPEQYEQKVEKSSQSILPPVEQSDKDIKSKCETQGSQQTPLMFSRCSSLGSLNGFEQNSINDDRSSIISDFSRRTSGVVSPSELPDSPAHTTSSRVLQQKSQTGCFGKRKIQLQHDKPKVCQQLPLPNENSFQSENILKRLPVAKRSVFEDNITSFKDESTPTKLHSMAASSLSSLTIDDDDDYDLINKIISEKEKQNPTEETKIQNDRQEPIGESNFVSSLTNEEKIESISQEQDDFIGEVEVVEEDDELMDLTPYEEQVLDECIRRGIAMWTKRNINEIKPFSWDLGLTCRATRAMLTSRIRVNSYSDIHNEIVEKHKNHRKNQVINNNSKFEQETEEFDNREKYSNKGTGFSETMVNVKEANDQYVGNYYTTYEEHLLDQCIRRGMAKITRRNINEIRPFSWDANQICLTTRAMVVHGPQ